MVKYIPCMIICFILFLGCITQNLSFSRDYDHNSSLSVVQLDIGSITGGIGGITVTVINNGDEMARDVPWTILIDGGLFGRINDTSMGVLTQLSPGETAMLTSGPLFGLGDVTVKILVGTVDKSVNGYVFFLYTFVISELTLEFETIASGLIAPVVLTSAHDGTNRLFIADQTGLIYLIDDNTLLPEPFMDISSKVIPLDDLYDERGLLGLAFHPRYGDNGRFFVYYSAPSVKEGIDHETILSEYRVSSLNPNRGDRDSEKILLRIDQPELNHNGGQIEFGPDGYLYLGIGDGGGAGDQHGTIGNGQDITTLLGSILRIDVDGEDTHTYTIPPDNPFVGREGRDEIYAFGFRNPWKFSFDIPSNRLIVADVGQDEWEELDFVEPGGNYGWRILEGTHPYDPDLADLLNIDIETLKAPFHEYSHSVGRSITGGYMYHGNQSPKLLDRYVFGDWSTNFLRPNGKLFYLEEIQPGRWERFEFRLTETFERFVLAFGEDDNGEIYALSKTTLGPTGTTGDVRKLIVT